MKSMVLIDIWLSYCKALWCTFGGGGGGDIHECPRNWLLIAEGRPAIIRSAPWPCSQAWAWFTPAVSLGRAGTLGSASLGTLFLCWNLSSVLKLVDVITASSTSFALS